MPPAFIMKFILASSADPCQPDFIKIRRGPLRVIKLLSKIQEDRLQIFYLTKQSGKKKIRRPTLLRLFAGGYKALVKNLA